MIGLAYDESRGSRRYGLTVWDRPEGPYPVALAEKHLSARRMPDGPAKTALLQEVNEAAAAGAFGRQRMFFGRNAEGEAVVALSDKDGRVRIRLAVRPDGEPRLEFLDQEGRVSFRLPPAGSTDGSGTL